jgi:sodium-independent sulfate anion transporter 11
MDNPPSKYTDQLLTQVKKIPAGSKSYIKNLFPIVQWLPKYNFIWFSGDITAAITIAILVIPQSLAYGSDNK